MKFEVPREIQEFHRKYGNNVKWKLSFDGLEVEGSGIERSRGNPDTVTRVWEDYSQYVNEYAEKYKVPAELIIATICTESGGDEDAIRRESEYTSDEETPTRISPGIMQTLISTARGSLEARGAPEASEISRNWLLIARNSINAGTSYIADQKSQTKFDPVLVAAAYNAGGIYRQNGQSNRFKLRQFPIGTSEHCDRWIKWFNDFWFILKDHEIRPVLSMYEYFHSISFSLPLDLSTGIKPTRERLDEYYHHIEKEFTGGYFPVGANTVWHGGVHLHANIGSKVFACAPGKIIAARLPENEELAIGHYGSRNFIIVKHKLDDKHFYSLYMHLKNEFLSATKNEAIKKIPWLQKEEIHYKSKIGNLNYRSVSTIDNNEPLGQLQAGDTVKHLSDANPAPWKKVLLPDNARVFLYCSDRYVDTITKIKLNTDKLNLLKKGNVEKFDISVQAGEQIWTSGDYGSDLWIPTGLKSRAGLLHWEIFSKENLFPPEVNERDADNEITTAPGASAGETSARNVLVKKLEGPQTASPGDKVIYKAIRFNYNDPTPQELQKINWRIEENGKKVENYKNTGQSVIYEIPKELAGKTLTVMPYLNSPTPEVSIKTSVAAYEKIKWKVVEDNDNNYNLDSEEIFKIFGPELIGTDKILTTEELKNFYANDEKAKQLRSCVCKFVSEWGIPDIDKAIKKLRDRWFTWGLKEHIKPYIWWQDAVKQGVDIPESPHVWHYNPIRFMEAQLYAPCTSASDQGYYGGYTLQKGDKDILHKWGGEIQSKDGEYVKELQKDLVKLGYWISHPISENGMKADGDFGNKVRGAVITFQKEHELTADGKVGSRTAEKIKTAVSDSEFKRPGHQTPTHGRFYQLEPSEDFDRYSPDYDSNHVLNDVWGTQKTRDMIRDAASAWMEEGKHKFAIGDISKYNGGYFSPHSSHKDGTGVDFDSDIYCSIDRVTFNKEDALELAKLLVEKGAKRILFNCKYVIDECAEVYALKKHHHHMHIDTKEISTRDHQEWECKWCKRSVYDSCSYREKSQRQRNELS